MVAVGVTTGATFGVAFLVGALAGLVLSPDLDQDSKVYSHYITRTVFGKWAEVLLLTYFYPYSRSIPHRSSLSHAPVIGTLLRVVYVFWWVFLLYPEILLSQYFAVAALALATVDTMHWCADYLL